MAFNAPQRGGTLPTTHPKVGFGQCTLRARRQEKKKNGKNFPGGGGSSQDVGGAIAGTPGMIIFASPPAQTRVNARADPLGASGRLRGQKSGQGPPHRRVLRAGTPIAAKRSMIQVLWYATAACSENSWHPDGAWDDAGQGEAGRHWIVAREQATV